MRHLESKEQRAVIEWFALAACGLRADPSDLFAIPNGGKRDKRTAGMLKKEGVRAGVPDLFLAQPIPVNGGRSRAGMFIELKKAKGGRVSDSQVTMLFRLRRNGYECVVAHGFEQATRAITKYLQGQEVAL